MRFRPVFIMALNEWLLFMRECGDCSVVVNHLIMMRMHYQMRILPKIDIGRRLPAAFLLTRPSRTDVAVTLSLSSRRVLHLCTRIRGYLNRGHRTLECFNRTVDGNNTARIYNTRSNRHSRRSSMSDTAGLSGDTDHVLLPLSSQSADTLMYLARLAQDSHMQISPFCYEHPACSVDVKQVRGWVLDIPSAAKSDVLPIGHAMFDGICVAQCMLSETEILDILRDAPAFKARLGAAVKRIRHRTEEHPEQRATWARCQPVSTGYPRTLFDASRHRTTGSVVFAPAPASVPIIDSDTWIPELSDNGFVGIFHHWFHGAQDHRLCLYIACRSYLPSACLEFADLVHDMGQLPSCTPTTVLLSEEAHWLRRANHRNRCRIIAEVCGELGLKVQTTPDHNAQVPKDFAIAVPDVETLSSDMYFINDYTIRITNSLSETSMASNGICCMLAPWQGVWIAHDNDFFLCLSMLCLVGTRISYVLLAHDNDFFLSLRS